MHTLLITGYEDLYIVFHISDSACDRKLFSMGDCRISKSNALNTAENFIMLSNQSDSPLPFSLFQLYVFHAEIPNKSHC